MKLREIICLAGLFASVVCAFAENPQPSKASGLREVLNDAHAEGADHWVYNDLEIARAEARKLNKPIFVTFRCVPCKACSGFDAEVAKGSELIKTLAVTHFVALRQVEMKGVDLSQFQFDYDLNWAAMFINADGTVYGRYGTQSADGPDAFNSIASLEQAMMRVLKLHAAYPSNAPALAAKRGPTKPYKTALDMPELVNKEQRSGPTERKNCIHCHNIHDAENEFAYKHGTLTRDMLWRYPLPDNVGLHIDRDDGCKVEKVTADSPAARAGLKAGDVITHVNNQPIISIADIQWVLHNSSNVNTRVEIIATRNRKASTYALKLAAGWKQTDFSWRGSRWSLKPRPGFWAPEVKGEELKSLGLAEGNRAYRIQWINLNQVEGRAAKQAGFREGDIIVAAADKPLTLSPEQFQMSVRMNYKVGEKLPLTVLRNGKRERIELTLVE